MGRKYKVLEQSTGNLTKLQQEAKYKSEFLAIDGFQKLQPTPPRYLNGVAKQEYQRVINELDNLPIRMLDHAEFELYCFWYSIFKSSVQDLSKLPEDKSPDKLLARIHKATLNIKSLTSDLGMTINARMQMSQPQNNDKDESKTMKGMFGNG